MIFDTGHRQAPSFNNFHIGRSQHNVVHAVQQLSAGFAQTTAADLGAYLWGSGGTGKSHLLQAAAAAATGAGMNSTALSGDAPAQAVGLVAVDDIESLDDEAQARLLELIKSAYYEAPQTVVLAAGRQAPGALRLRDDLRSRLCELPAYRIENPNDPDLELAVVAYAKRLGRHLPQQIAREMVFNLRRNMTSLALAMDDIDRRAMEGDHDLSAPLVRKWLAR